MKKSFLLLFCMLLLATNAMSAAELNVYASGLKVTSLQDRKVTISYTLNAPATSLQLQLIQGENVKYTFPLSENNQLTKGLHEDVLIDLTSVVDGNYTWALVASNTTANTQTTKVVGGLDAATRFQFYSPQGLVVDNNPNSPLFGQIYITESWNATTAGGRKLTEGVYILSADLKDINNQGNTAYDGSIKWADKMYGPARISLDKEGYLYVCNNGKDTSGVYRFNPITKEFAQTLNTDKRGEIYTRINSAVVTGEGHNKKLWAIDTKTTENGGPAISTHLVRYNIGIDSTNYAGHPDTIADIHNYLQNINNTLVKGVHNDFWIFQYRNSSDTSVPAIIHINNEGVVDATFNFQYCRRGSGAISPDGTKLAFNGLNNGNKIRLFDVSYDENKKPTITETITTIGSAENVDGIAFDVANNLYFVSATNELLNAYALPKADNTHTTYAPNNQNIMLATPRIMAYNLRMKKVGDNYQFSFYANSQATSAKLLFYQDDINDINNIKHEKTFKQTFNKGHNTISVPASEIAGKGELHWALQLTGNRASCFGEVYHQDTTLSRAHAVIDNSPESDFFGRIYISNRKDLTTEKDRGEVYILNNTDYSLIYSGKLKNSNKQDVELGSAARPAVDAEGYVYWADYGDTYSGVQVMNPYTLTATQFFNGEKDNNGVWSNNNVPMGSSSPGAHIYGTGANTKLFLLNEDKVEGKLPGNGYLVYNIGQNNGSIRRTWDTAPSQTVQILDSMAGNFSIVGTSHGAFVCQNRTLGHNESRAFSLQFYDNEGNCKYQSRDRSLTINGSFGAGMAVSADERKLAMVNGNGNILMFNIEWENDNTPVLNFTELYTTNYAVISTIHFDYAGNLVVTAGTGYAKEGIVNDLRMVVFSLPTDNNNTTTIPAPKKQTINSLKGKKVYIDPGHGKLDYNSQKTIPNTLDNNVGAFCESSANLRRSTYLKEKLIAAGVEVAMTREENSNTQPQAWEIGRRVCQNNNDFDYFISIHSNAPSNVPTEKDSSKVCYNDTSLSNYPMIIYRGYTFPNDNNNDISFYSPGSYEMANTTWKHIYGLMEGISSPLRPNNDVGEKFIVGDLDYYDPQQDKDTSNDKNASGNPTHVDITTYTYDGVDYKSYLGAIRHMVPGFLVEGFHHTYAPARHRALNQDYCNMEGLAYFRGIMEYFGAEPEIKGYILGVLKDTTALMQDTMEAKGWGSDLYNFHAGSHDMYMPCNGAVVTLKQGETTIDTYIVDNLWNGIFAFYDLEPGTYTIESQYKGITTKYPAFEVTANETTYQVLYTRESEAQHRIWAYDLRLNNTYQGYTFKFKSVLDSHEASLILKDGEGDTLAIHALPIVNKGANSFSLTFDQMPEALQFNDIYWEIQLSSAPVYPEIPGAVATLREVITNNDNDIYKFYLPQGVAVDNNPNSDYFGRIYVAESTDGANSDGQSDRTKSQKRGIFVFDQNLNDLNPTANVGILPTNAATAMTNKTRQAIHRIAINPTNNHVAFAYNVSGNTAVWSMNPENLSGNATNLIEQVSITKANAICFDKTGALYIMDNANSSSGGILVRIFNKNQSKIQKGIWLDEDISIVPDGRGGLWIAQHRWDVNDYAVLSHVNANMTIDFKITDNSSGYFPHNYNGSYRGQCAYNEKEDILAFGGNRVVSLFKITYDNAGKPSIDSHIASTPLLGECIDGIAFDHAGDLYVLSASTERFYKFAVPTQNNTCTTPAPESQKIPRTLVLKDTEDNKTILDDAKTQTLNALVYRSLTAGMFNTLCLPFDASITEGPLAGAKAYTFSGSSETTGGDILLHFNEAGSIVAGTPYLIEPATNIQGPIDFTNITISKSEGSSDGSGDIKFNGILAPKALTQGDKSILFLVSDNKLAWANANANMNGMRAYFSLPNGAYNKLNTRARIVTSSSTTTDLQQTTTTSTNAQKLILNGILYILKDGQLYTVFGTKVK